MNPRSKKTRASLIEKLRERDNPTPKEIITQSIKKQDDNTESLIDELILRDDELSKKILNTIIIIFRDYIILTWQLEKEDADKIYAIHLIYPLTEELKKLVPNIHPFNLEKAVKSFIGRLSDYDQNQKIYQEILIYWWEQHKKIIKTINSETFRPNETINKMINFMIERCDRGIEIGFNSIKDKDITLQRKINKEKHIKEKQFNILNNITQKYAEKIDFTQYKTTKFSAFVSSLLQITYYTLPYTALVSTIALPVTAILLYSQNIIITPSGMVLSAMALGIEVAAIRSMLNPLIANNEFEFEKSYLSTCEDHFIRKLVLDTINIASLTKASTQTNRSSIRLFDSNTKKESIKILPEANKQDVITEPDSQIISDQSNIKQSRKLNRNNTHQIKTENKTKLIRKKLEENRAQKEEAMLASLKDKETKNRSLCNLQENNNIILTNQTKNSSNQSKLQDQQNLINYDNQVYLLSGTPFSPDDIGFIYTLNNEAIENNLVLDTYGMMKIRLWVLSYHPDPTSIIKNIPTDDWDLSSPFNEKYFQFLSGLGFNCEEDNYSYTKLTKSEDNKIKYDVTLRKQHYSEPVSPIHMGSAICVTTEQIKDDDIIQQIGDYHFKIIMPDEYKQTIIDTCKGKGILFFPINENHDYYGYILAKLLSKIYPLLPKETFNVTFKSNRKDLVSYCQALQLLEENYFVLLDSRKDCYHDLLQMYRRFEPENNPRFYMDVIRCFYSALIKVKYKLDPREELTNEILTGCVKDFVSYITIKTNPHLTPNEDIIQCIIDIAEKQKEFVFQKKLQDMRSRMYDEYNRNNPSKSNILYIPPTSSNMLLAPFWSTRGTPQNEEQNKYTSLQTRRSLFS